MLLIELLVPQFHAWWYIMESLEMKVSAWYIFTGVWPSVWAVDGLTVSCGRGCRPARRAIDQSEGQGGEGTTVTSPVLLQYQLFIIIFANFVYSDQLFSLRTSSKFAPTFTAALQNATELDLTFALLIPSPPLILIRVLFASVGKGNPLLIMNYLGKWPIQ